MNRPVVNLHQILLSMVIERWEDVVEEVPLLTNGLSWSLH